MLSRQYLLTLKPRAPFSFQPPPTLPGSGTGLDGDLCTKGGDERGSASAAILIPPILIARHGNPRDGKSPSRGLETLSSTQNLQLGPIKKSLFRLKRDFFVGVETRKYI